MPSPAYNTSKWYPLVSLASDSLVTNCVFTCNWVNAWAAKDGGYALISPMQTGAHALTPADCLFTRNTIASPNVQAASGSYVLGVVGNNYNGLALTVRNCVFDDNEFSYAEVDGVTPILVRSAFTKGTTSQLTFVNNTVTGPRPEGVLDILQYGDGHTKPLKVYNSLFLYDGDILDNLFSASASALWDIRHCAIQNLDAAHRPADIAVSNGLTTDPVPLDASYAPASRVPGLDSLYTADDAVPAYETIRGAIQTLPAAVASSHYLVARRNPLAGGTVSLPAQAVANGAAISPVTATPASAANSFLGWYTADANGEPDTLLTSEATLSAATVPAMASLTTDTIVIASFGQPQVAITFDLGSGGTFDGTGARTAVISTTEGDAFPAVPDWTPNPDNDVDYWRTGGNTTDNRSRCFVAEDYAVTNVAFSGLTFTGFKSGTIYVAKGGEAIRLDDCRFIACGTTTAPAVVNVIDAPATIEGCEFTGCYCSMRLQSATADHVFTVTNCLFDANFGENFGASFFFGPYQGKNNSRLILADTRAKHRHRLGGEDDLLHLRRRPQALPLA